MSKIILVVEDKKDEQLIAKEVVLSSGNKIIIADTLKKGEEFIKKFEGKISGIITDLHFPIDSGREGFGGANGISVVLTALRCNIPCTVCTDDVAHGATYFPLIIERLEMLTGKSIPLSGTKDWDQALQELLTIM